MYLYPMYPPSPLLLLQERTRQLGSMWAGRVNLGEGRESYDDGQLQRDLKAEGNNLTPPPRPNTETSAML